MPSTTETDEAPPQGSSVPSNNPSPMAEHISNFPRIHTGVGTRGKHDADTSGMKAFDDPFANQRDTRAGSLGQDENERLASASASPIDRRKSSDEWGK